MMTSEAVPETVRLLTDRAPGWPLAGPTPAAAALSRSPVEAALHAVFWQVNPRGRLGTLVCDCDQADPIEAVWAGLAPPPTALVHNEASGHCHALYVLAEPVGQGARSSPAAIRYAEAVWSGLEVALSADASYTGLLSRGPLAPGHTLEVISGRAYELAELAKGVQLAGRVHQDQELHHADSRNRAIFDAARHRAYKVAASLDDAQLLAEVLQAAQRANESLHGHPRGPLSVREVTTIARSIYRWCVPRRASLAPKLPGAVDRSRMHSKDRPVAAPEAIQKARQSQGQAMTAERRREATRAEIRAGLTLLGRQGVPVTAAALEAVTGVPRRTLHNHADLWFQD